MIAVITHHDGRKTEARSIEELSAAVDKAHYGTMGIRITYEGDEAGVQISGSEPREPDGSPDEAPILSREALREFLRGEEPIRIPKWVAKAAIRHLRGVAESSGGARLDDEEIVALDNVAGAIEACMERPAPAHPPGVRRPIQITVATGTRKEPDCLYALCNDGSIWSSWGGKPWIRHAAIPQGEEASEPSGKPKKIAEEIIGERRRQIIDEGWSTEHDDKHDDESLAMAAACYAFPDIKMPGSLFDWLWPSSWSTMWWKPKSRRRNLIRAAALIVAEIERLDRLKAKEES